MAETYLLNYPGAVFIVSHDRYFLDKVATKIVEIDNGKVSTLREITALTVKRKPFFVRQLIRHT